MQNKLLIVGNPNTGKTTLFNALTGAREKTANYGGVTVQAKEGNFNCAGQNVELVDLPGVYSFSDSSKDEQVTEQYLSDYKDCPVLFVCSSSDIKRNMILLSEVANKGHKLLVLVNRMGTPVDEAGISQLKNILNVPVLQADVKNAKDDLIDWISTSVATNINEKIDFKNPFGFLVRNLD